MSQLDSFRGVLPLATTCAVVLASGGLSAQERGVLASQVGVSREDASLHLEFSDGDQLHISFEDGTARFDGDVLGAYEVGGEADLAWRGLLADILSLNNGALANALAEWQPQADGGDSDSNLLRALDRALEEAVAGSTQAPAEPRASRDDELGRLLRLLARSEYSQGLSEALEDADLDEVHVWLNEDHTVRQGETVDGTVVLVDGTLEVRGRVRGDVVVVGGRLRLDDGATVDGDIRLIESRVSRDGGEVRGTVVDVTRELRQNRDRIRDEIRREVENEVRRSVRYDRGRSHGVVSRAARAVGGVFETALTFLLLGGLALLLHRFGGHRLDAVVRAVGDNPARSAAVGFAGGFLVLPVYIIGILVLTVSIVGIPALLIWAPFFPVAVALGAFVGYLGVGHHVGRWVLNHDFHWLDWVNENSEAQVRLVGLGSLLAPFAAASLLQALPIVGWMGGIVGFLGSLACLVALVMGFGAVIITRGGRYDGYDFTTDDGDFGFGAEADDPEGLDPDMAPGAGEDE
ncbi:MAG: hypothetical protein OEO23_03640 [Gemmatimonadota bacterium]|nr:hypothetical protein [Gemmatimonadota bacterium]